MSWERQYHWHGLHFSIRSIYPAVAIGGNIHYKPDTTDVFQSPREGRFTLHLLFMSFSLLSTNKRRKPKTFK